MPILRNIGTLATCRHGGGQAELHSIHNAALAWSNDTIRWVGPESDLPARFHNAESLDAGGRLVIPGLVDCHTHLAFAGWRAHEFERRLAGESYLDIAASGGGIAATVRATRAATEDELTTRALAFLAAMQSLGVTTVEAKSGYGLTVADELKLLRVYRSLASKQPIRLVPTVLSAHTIPPEYRQNREGYIDLIVNYLIPQVARERLATCCDAFVEHSAFTAAEGKRILEAGRAAGLYPKVHADQLSASGGAELAAAVGALSADHLEHVTPEGIHALARAGVVAVSLPLATLYLGGPPMPARHLIAANVPVAVATDFNPGSAPSYDLPLAMLLACTLQHMTPAEALKGATIYAAQAVALAHRIGSLESGKCADFAIIDAPDVTHWLYHFRPNACVMTVIGGTVVWREGSAPDTARP